MKNASFGSFIPVALAFDGAVLRKMLLLAPSSPLRSLLMEPFCEKKHLWLPLHAQPDLIFLFNSNQNQKKHRIEEISVRTPMQLHRKGTIFNSCLLCYDLNCQTRIPTERRPP